MKSRSRSWHGSRTLDFVQQCKRLAKQALGKHAGEPAAGGFARWKYVVLHCLRIEDEYTYRELIDPLSLMTDIREELELVPDDLPDPSTVCKAFDRYKMWVWRQLLRRWEGDRRHEKQMNETGTGHPSSATVPVLDADRR